MRTTASIGVVAVLTVVPFVEAGSAGSVFDDISAHYETIRQSLMKDSTDGLAEHALAMRDLAAALEDDFSVERAGVPTGDSQLVRELLPEVEDRAHDLSAANDLEDARTAFAELTKPLVRWHGALVGDRLVVAYCPMVKRPWLQPDEAIGNPYDPSMLRCGDVVAR
jgi:hypothetical protein